MQQGAGRHITTVNPATFPRLELLFYCGEVIFSSAVGLVKLSVLAFYWRIFSASQSIRNPIWITAALVVAWIFAPRFSAVPRNDYGNRRFLVTALQSLRSSWAPRSPKLLRTLSSSPSQFPISGDYIRRRGRNSFSPAPSYLEDCKYHSHRPTPLDIDQRFSACVSSILRLWAFMTRDYTSLDLTWTTAGSIEWSCVEVAMAMISACLLSLRPILTWVRTGSAHPTTDAEASHAALNRSKQPSTSSTRASGSRSQMVQTGKFLKMDSSMTHSGKHIASDSSTPREQEPPRISPLIPGHWSERAEWAELTALPLPGLSPPQDRREVVSGADLPEVVQEHYQ